MCFGGGDRSAIFQRFAASRLKVAWKSFVQSFNLHSGCAGQVIGVSSESPRDNYNAISVFSSQSGLTAKARATSPAPIGCSSQIFCWIFLLTLPAASPAMPTELKWNAKCLFTQQELSTGWAYNWPQLFCRIFHIANCRAELPGNNLAAPLQSNLRPVEYDSFLRIAAGWSLKVNLRTLQETASQRYAAVNKASRRSQRREYFLELETTENWIYIRILCK